MRTRILALAILLVWTIPPIYAQMQGCRICIQRRRSDPPTCGFCTGSDGCKCDIGRLTPTVLSCIPCGCCSYIPGTGGVCYDKTGQQCGREVCSEPLAPVNASSPPQTSNAGPVSLSSLTAEELVKESPWLADADFQQKIRGLSRYMGDFVWFLQEKLKKTNRLPAREGRTVSDIHLYFLDDYTADCKVTKAGNVWRLEVSPHPAPPDLPNILEIQGRDWRLIHHIHGVDTTEKIVYKGVY
jgi:hypothetical protein